MEKGKGRKEGDAVLSRGLKRNLKSVCLVSRFPRALQLSFLTLGEECAECCALRMLNLTMVVRMSDKSFRCPLTLQTQLGLASLTQSPSSRLYPFLP